MASFYSVALVLCVFAVVAHSTDLHMGSSLNATIVHLETVQLSSIPLTTRTKNVFYSGDGVRPIKGIDAIDIIKSKAKVIITAGGLNSSFVNIRLKSERGKALHYQIQIYA